MVNAYTWKLKLCLSAQLNQLQECSKNVLGSLFLWQGSLDLVPRISPTQVEIFLATA